MTKDISKCAGTDCKRKEECIRYTHPAREKFQSYLIMHVAIKDVDDCRFFAATLEELAAK